MTYFVRVYMRRCHAMHILVDKSHNNAVITNDVFLLVYVIIFVLYTYCNDFAGFKIARYQEFSRIPSNSEQALLEPST